MGGAKHHPIFAILTDFGTRDHYAAAVKGVLLSACPNAQIVDISHDVSPQNIIGGAYILGSAYAYMPEGTVHIAVVDPEVGGSRRPLAACAGKWLFVAPDNGILGYVLSKERNWRAYAIEPESVAAGQISRTFHGRDLFAPAAAKLALGAEPSDLGPQVEDPVFPENLFARVREGGISGEVIHTDRFGNLITNITESAFESWRGAKPLQDIVVSIGGVLLRGISGYYAEVPRGKPLVLFGSSGHLEVAVNQGSAADFFGVREGTPVLVEFAG
jgi:hypothetical protein